MIAAGNFRYYLDNESKTIEEIRKLVNTTMTVSISGLDVHYFSPKKENRVEKILKQVEQYQNKNGGLLEGIEFPFDSISPYKKDLYKNMIEDFDKKLQTAKKETEGKLFYELEGIKESIGKTDYSEINLEILDLMAERFTANKHKYPKGNMKKPLNKISLVWAAFRHIRKMLQPIKNDPETFKEHLVAVLCNMSMILDQENLKHKKIEE
jgi:hypothetical protein